MQKKALFITHPLAGTQPEYWCMLTLAALYCSLLDLGKLTLTQSVTLPDIVLDLSITVAINPSSCNIECGNTLCEHMSK